MKKKKKPENARAVKRATKKSGRKKRSIPESFELTEIEQLNAIAKPIRQKIMAEFVDEPRTTKQVAERLGEPPTRLYHHVEALAKNGLLVLDREVPKRGTTEKYYQAAARQFTVAEHCLGESKFQDKSSRLVSRMLDDAKAGIMKGLKNKNDTVESTVAVNALVQTTPREIEKLSGALLKTVNKLDDKQKKGASNSSVKNYRVVVLVYEED